MARQFEDLIAWQKARALVLEVYRVTESHPFASDYSLKDQVRRCAGSVMANIAEGFDRGSPAEFRRFIDIARGTCEVARILGGLRKSLNSRGRS